MSNKYKVHDTTFTLKAVSDEGVISGYGSVFDVVDQGDDIVATGAFTRTLNSGKSVKMLWQHHRDEPIGVWTDISVDEYGLKVTGQINMDTKQGRETLALLKQGALDGLSIGFIVVKFEYNDDGIFIIKELNLKEVSIVTFPMNEDATILSAKSDAPELTVKQINQVSDFIHKMIAEDGANDEPIIQEDEETMTNIIEDFIKDDKEKNMVTDIHTSINK